MSHMLRALMGRVYRDEANDGATGGAGGGSPAGDTPPAAPPAGETPPAAGKKPSDEEARLLKENMKRKEELRAANEALAKMQDKIKQFEGIDPEAVRSLLAEKSKAEERQLEAKGDYDRLKQRMADEHTKQTQELKAQIEAMQNELSKASGTIKELSIGTQFGQSKFITDELTLTPAKARVVYADHFDLDNGKVIGYDKPRGAPNRTALVDQYGEPVGFDDAMRKIVEADPDKEHLFRSKVRSGANSANSDSRTKAQTEIPIRSGKQNGIDKISSGLKTLKVNFN